MSALLDCGDAGRRQSRPAARIILPHLPAPKEISHPALFHPSEPFLTLSGPSPALPDQSLTPSERAFSPAGQGFALSGRDFTPYKSSFTLSEQGSALSEQTFALPE